MSIKNLLRFFFYANCEEVSAFSFPKRWTSFSLNIHVLNTHRLSEPPRMIFCRGKCDDRRAPRWFRNSNWAWRWKGNQCSERMLIQFMPQNSLVITLSRLDMILRHGSLLEDANMCAIEAPEKKKKRTKPFYVWAAITAMNNINYAFNLLSLFSWMSRIDICFLKCTLNAFAEQESEQNEAENREKMFGGNFPRMHNSQTRTRTSNSEECFDRFHSCPDSFYLIKKISLHQTKSQPAIRPHSAFRCSFAPKKSIQRHTFHSAEVFYVRSMLLFFPAQFYLFTFRTLVFIHSLMSLNYVCCASLSLLSEATRKCWKVHLSCLLSLFAPRWSRGNHHK